MTRRAGRRSRSEAVTGSHESNATTSSPDEGGAKAGSAGGERRAVHVVRLLDEGEVRRERLVDDRVAEAQAGETVELREAPQQHDAPPLFDGGEPGQAPIDGHVVAVRLVHD